MEEKKMLKKKERENLVPDHKPKYIKMVSVEKVYALTPLAF